MRYKIGLKWFLCLCFILSICNPCAAYVFSVVIAEKTPESQKIIDAVAQVSRGDHTFNVYEMRDLKLMDPIRKMALLAQISAGDLVVVVGQELSEWVIKELVESNIFVVDAARLSDAAMQSPNVSGISGYSSVEMIEITRKLFPKSNRFGVLYTVGYAKSISAFKWDARKNGLFVDDRLVRGKKQIGPLSRELLTGTDLLWLEGGSNLFNDLAVRYVLGQALIRLHPTLVKTVREVQQGGLFCFLPDYDDLGRQTEKLLERKISSAFNREGNRIEFSESVRAVAINKNLAKRMHLKIPSDITVVWID